MKKANLIQSIITVSVTHTQILDFVRKNTILVVIFDNPNVDTI